MIQPLETLIKEINSKPSWGSKELITKIQSTSNQITDRLDKEGKIMSIVGAKKNKVSIIKKYDLLYAPTMGIPHYFLVHKVIDEAVHGIIFTSTNKPAFCIHEVKSDRILEGSFATHTYMAVDLTVALECFVRTYESKTEADLIFKKVSEHYLSIFKK